jgi:hypothetical protein
MDIIHDIDIAMIFQRLDSVTVFRWNLLRWAQQKELVSISRDRGSTE